MVIHGDFIDTLAHEAVEGRQKVQELYALLDRAAELLRQPALMPIEDWNKQRDQWLRDAEVEEK